MVPMATNKNVPPDAAAVMKRAIVLKHLFVKALATPPSEYLTPLMESWSDDERKKFNTEAQSQYARQIDRLREGGLWDEMGQNERDFMQAGPIEVSPQALIDANWLGESTVCLLWALGHVSELQPYDQPAKPELTNELPAKPFQVLIENAVLRAGDKIRKQRDLAELWHWRARTRQLRESGRVPQVLSEGLTIERVIQMAATKAAEDGAFKTPIGNDFPAFNKPYRDLTRDEFSIATSIAVERHRALNWLCGYAPRNRWADTPTDT
jgi:Domain of unknown function (DUF4272)